MKTLKIIFRAIFGVQTLLNLLFIPSEFFPRNAYGATIEYIGTYILLFLQFPIFIIFTLVVLYNFLIRKIPISFFKIEFLYILSFIGTLLLNALVGYYLKK